MNWKCDLDVALIARHLLHEKIKLDQTIKKSFNAQWHSAIDHMWGLRGIRMRLLLIFAFLLVSLAIPSDATDDGEASAVWSEWGEWSECDPTCSCGKKFRFRNCNNAPSTAACDGDPSETAACSSKSTNQPFCQNTNNPGWYEITYVAFLTPSLTQILLSENTNATSVEFFDNVFTFFNESVAVNCCHPNKTIEVATCGLGASCAGSCSALAASLCPSGDCTGECELPFEQETADHREGSSGISVATIDQRKIKWCTNKCNVWKNEVCCYHPVCRNKSKSHKSRCSWFNYLTGNW